MIAEDVSYRPTLEEPWHWQHLLDGQHRGSVEDARTPFGYSAAGRWDLAAQGWDARGCPFEAAFARFVLGGLEGDVASLQAAHRTFAELGATPMATRTSAARRQPRGADEPARTHRSRARGAPAAPPEA